MRHLGREPGTHKNAKKQNKTHTQFKHRAQGQNTQVKTKQNKTSTSQTSRTDDALAGVPHRLSTAALSLLSFLGGGNSGLW